MPHEREQNVIGWHRHELDGYSDVGHTAHAEVESVAVVPSPDGTRDELWMVVQRYINGGVKRYVEYLTKPWEQGDARENAVFLDCSLAYDGSPATTVTGLTHLAGETVSILADDARLVDVRARIKFSPICIRAKSFPVLRCRCDGRHCGRRRGQSLCRYRPKKGHGSTQ